MATTARVLVFPKCDFHPNEVHPAEFDFKTLQGPWGNGCREAWELNRAYPDLGTGKGQRLVEDKG